MIHGLKGDIMASIYQLKSNFQNLLRPITNLLANLGITANQVTILALLLSVFNGVALIYEPTRQWALISLPILLFIRMALNAIDGMLAREHNMKSALGAILNEVGDILSDAFLYVPFVYIFPEAGTLILLMLALSFLGEFVGVVAVQILASRRYDGPMGKSDRAFVFGLLAVLLCFEISLSDYIEWIFVVLNVLALLTILNRARHGLREAK